MSVRSVCALSVFAAIISGATLSAQNTPMWGSGSYDASRRTPSGPTWNIVTAPPNGGGATDVGTVSINELAHKVPAKALKEWERAQKARDKGQTSEAVAHFEKATDIDPEFVAAHNNAGALLLLEGKSEPALKHLQACVKLDPHNAMPVSNMAVAYMMQQRFADAEEAARRGLDLDRTGNRVRLIYALSLVMQDKFTQDAMQALERAQDEYPQARLLSARIYAAWGKRDEALESVNIYLKSGEPTGVDLAKQWKEILENLPQRQPVMAKAQSVSDQQQ